ncbi:MAG: hypothetical protein ABW171_07180, partial [Steroidobacter sp.]
MEQLHNLLEIREIRLRRLQDEFARQRAVLALVDEEIASIDNELAQIARQRVLWEHEWQQWLQRDGVLRHGQDYNLSHVALSAWRQDAMQARAETWIRREQAAAQVDQVRQRLLKAEQRIRALRQQLHDAKRQRVVQRVALDDSRAQDEAVPRRAAVCAEHSPGRAARANSRAVEP